MFRKKAAAFKQSSDSIKWRGHEITRIEAFSDAVFAFAVTLLIVALEVPESYEQLMHTMMFFVPFAVCFVILMLIWFAQNLFFRRYGLHDTYTVVLNGILLFLVLFFVYPLKFLFARLMTLNAENLTGYQAQHLFYVYSGGFVAIYVMFVLMYHNVLRHREQLKLTPEEVFDTGSHMYSYVVIVIIGLLSLGCAFIGGQFLNYAGIVYALIGVGIMWMYSVRARIRRKKFKTPPAETAVMQNVPEENNPVTY